MVVLFIMFFVIAIIYFFIFKEIRTSKNRLKEIRENEKKGGHNPEIDIATVVSPKPVGQSPMKDNRNNGNVRMRTNEPRMKQEHKLAMIGFVITLGFTVTFVSFVIVDTIVMITRSDPEQFEGNHLVLHSFFMRSFFLNLISHPIIYGVMNTKFRNAVYDIFCTRS